MSAETATASSVPRARPGFRIDGGAITLTLYLLFLMLPNRFRLMALFCGTGFGVASFLTFGTDLHQQFLALLLGETSELLAPWQNNVAAWPLVLPSGSKDF